MTDDWRKIPKRDRPYDAFRRGRYVDPECDHNGVLCKCDAPYWLRPSTPAEQAHEARIRGGVEPDAEEAAP